jgi:hypothetical protein
MVTTARTPGRLALSHSLLHLFVESATMPDQEIPSYTAQPWVRFAKLATLATGILLLALIYGGWIEMA